MAAPPLPPRPEIIGDIPVVARSHITDTTGTPDAERRTYLAPVPLDSLVRFHRAVLQTLGWQIKGDQADVPAGMVDLYAVKGAQTVWVHMEKRGADSVEATLVASGRLTEQTTPVPGRLGGRH